MNFEEKIKKLYNNSLTNRIRSYMEKNHEDIYIRTDDSELVKEYFKINTVDAELDAYNLAVKNLIELELKPLKKRLKEFYSENKDLIDQVSRDIIFLEKNYKNISEKEKLEKIQKY